MFCALYSNLEGAARGKLSANAWHGYCSHEPLLNTSTWLHGQRVVNLAAIIQLQ